MSSTVWFLESTFIKEFESNDSILGTQEAIQLRCAASAYWVRQI